MTSRDDVGARTSRRVDHMVEVSEDEEGGGGEDQDDGDLSTTTTHHEHHERLIRHSVTISNLANA